MKICNFSLLLTFVGSCLFGGETAEPNMARVSEAFGHLIYRNFRLLNVPFDIGKIVEGIEAAAAGKEGLITEKECIDAIHSEQEKKFKLLSKANLKQAEEFLAANAKQEGVVCLEGGKVQYKVVLPGKGAEVKNHFSPLIRCTVKLLDGADICPPNLEEPIGLDETIDGLKVGLLGMKEGEKRILYIHPDLAYGEKVLPVLYPNVLLTFEVEVLKVNGR
jgi:peptidylprolyl isomerase